MSRDDSGEPGHDGPSLIRPGGAVSLRKEKSKEKSGGML